jgi:hypothetical protein
MLRGDVIAALDGTAVAVGGQSEVGEREQEREQDDEHEDEDGVALVPRGNPLQKAENRHQDVGAADA